MTDVVILSSSEQFSRELRQAFSLQRPDIIPLFADDPAASGAEIAACWFPESGTLNRYPQLKLIHSVAAGVDHLGAELLQSGKVICRVVDENQKQGMFEYILWAVLYFHRDLNKVLKNNQHRHWQRYPQRLASEICIGIMGLGEIGRYVGEKLAQLGYRVNGWSRSRKNLPEIRCFSGDSEREQFLNESNILINLLPLTPETQGILCAATLSQLPQSAALINCGRGDIWWLRILFMRQNLAGYRGQFLMYFHMNHCLQKIRYGQPRNYCDPAYGIGRIVSYDCPANWGKCRPV